MTGYEVLLQAGFFHNAGVGDAAVVTRYYQCERLFYAITRMTENILRITG